MIPKQLSSADSLKLQVYDWPLENPKAAILLIHGIGEHMGRYKHVGEALNAAGYAVAGLDHRGHGRSEGQPRAHVLDMDTYVDDLELLWEKIKAEYPGKPWFVLGHSMGGLIATRFALRHQTEMRGLILSGPALAIHKVTPAPIIQLGKWIAQAAPGLLLVPQIGSKHLTHDPAVNQAYDDDPLNYHGRIRAGMADAFLKGEADVLQRAATLTLPLLLLHGEQDRVVAPIASRLLYEKVGSADKTLKTYPNLKHEIFNDLEKEQVLSEVVAWLDAHL
jgi:alpha-beta hydrolase superfamily lysophospholipase